ncbi:MAG TPA: hypothetical protein HA330_00215, partial [Candidatus Thalassarchaeaceae archaeon]
IEGAYGGLPVASESVSWSEPVAETEGLGMLPLITAVLVGAILVGIAALQYSANLQKERDQGKMKGNSEDKAELGNPSKQRGPDLDD